MKIDVDIFSGVNPVEFVDLAREIRPPEDAGLVNENDLTVIVPAFVITELKEAFEIGFLIFLPFLVLDMVMPRCDGPSTVKEIAPPRATVSGGPITATPGISASFSSA